jgi:uncharacterized protein
VTLRKTLDQDFISAMKRRDELTVSVLRGLKTGMKNKEVDLRRPLEPTDIVQVISNQAKQRRDSMEQYLKGGRMDLFEREEAELKILEGYLPKQMDRGQIESALREIIVGTHASSPKDLGRVMKDFMSQYQGQADGRLVNEILRSLLDPH